MQGDILGKAEVFRQKRSFIHSRLKKQHCDSHAHSWWRDQIVYGLRQTNRYTTEERCGRAGSLRGLPQRGPRAARCAAGGDSIVRFVERAQETRNSGNRQVLAVPTHLPLPEARDLRKPFKHFQCRFVARGWLSSEAFFLFSLALAPRASASKAPTHKEIAAFLSMTISAMAP